MGPGLLESLYENALSHELRLKGIAHVRQKPVPVLYKRVTMDTGYRIDILVEDSLVLELKAVEKILPVFGAQVLTYLRLGNYPLGLLLNFNVPKLIDGIERISNHAPNLPAINASKNKTKL